VAQTNEFLILDGHSLAYRAFHGLPVENFATSSGQHTNAVYGFFSMLVNVLKERQPTHIAVAFDLSRETFRTAAYPEYKAGRAKTPPEFKGQVELIKQLLEALNISVVTVEGFEADDILATLAHHSPEPVRIISGDRDSFQLVNDNVTVLYPRKGMSDLVNMTDEAIREKYDVGAAQYRDLAALVGETSDNLPGIPGVGPKTAAKWINQYGSALEVLAHKDEITGKVGEALREHVALVERNYELNRLIDTLDIPTDVTAYEKREYDAAAVNQLLDALEFGALRARLFAAWPSGDAVADAAAGVKAGSGSKAASAGKTASSAKASEAKEDASETSTDLGESFSTEATQADAKVLKKWLGEYAKTPVALSFAGKWGRGTGTIDAIALTAEDGSAIWCTYIQGEEVLTNWLESDAPKIVHDAKGPAIALLNQGVRLGGLVSDPAIAAYIVSPGTRNFELGELVTRYLHKSLTLADKPEEERSLFSEEPEISGELLAMQARATLELAKHFDQDLAERGGASLFATIEIPLIGVLADLESAGIAVDVYSLRGLEATFDADVQAAVKQAHATVGREFNLGSPKQLQEVLFEERGLPKTKKIKTGYTTDAEALAGLLAKFPDDELLVALMRYREVSKLKQTVTTLLGCVADDERIHTTFNQMVAATGRLSSTDPNLQNIPIRTPEGMQIRDTFVVGKGYDTLLTADYSQIEVRVMAHLSNDTGLIEALKSGEDLHTTVGSQVFGVPAAEVNADMRRQIKAMSYGLAYGLSAYGLSQQLSISAGEAKGLMDTYFERFGGVRDYLAQIVVDARKLGYTESMFGRRRYLPDLNSDNRQLREMAERMALNAPIQGTAADIMKLAMLKVHDALREAGLKSRLLLQVHDELVLEVTEGELEQVTALVTECMQGAADLAVPLDVSVGVGTTWSKAGH